MREEEEANEAYGLKAEKEVTSNIQNLNFTRTKIRKRLEHLNQFETSPYLEIPAEFKEPIPFDTV